MDRHCLHRDVSKAKNSKRKSERKSSKYVLAESLIRLQTFVLCLFYFGEWPRRKHTEVSVCSMYGESQILLCCLLVSPLSCLSVIYSAQYDCAEHSQHTNIHTCAYSFLPSGSSLHWAVFLPPVSAEAKCQVITSCRRVLMLPGSSSFVNYILNANWNATCLSGFSIVCNQVSSLIPNYSYWSNCIKCKGVQWK